MRRALVAAVAILGAVLLQVTLLNNVPFPGGAGPNLVLVVVVALALTSSARRMLAPRSAGRRGSAAGRSGARARRRARAGRGR